jgi:hypothetical protein
VNFAVYSETYMQKKNPYNLTPKKKQIVRPKFGSGKFNNSRVGSSRPGNRGK